MLRELDPLAFKMAAVITSGASAVASAVTDNWPLQLFGVPLSVLLACFAGAVIALAFLPPMRGVKMFAAVLIGTAFGAWITPIVLHLLEWQKLSHLHLGVGAVCGALTYLALTWVFVRGPEILASRLKGGGT